MTDWELSQKQRRTVTRLLVGAALGALVVTGEVARAVFSSPEKALPLPADQSGQMVVDGSAISGSPSSYNSDSPFNPSEMFGGGGGHAAPGPAAALPFLIGLIRRRRR